MNCFLCDEPMQSGHAKWLQYGPNKKARPRHHVTAPPSSAERANSGRSDDPEDHTDTQLIDAIAAELLSSEWLARLEKLPTDEAQRDAVHQLRLSFNAQP